MPPLNDDDLRLLKQHTLGRAVTAGVPVRTVRIHQAGTSVFFSVQTKNAERTFVFDTKSLKSVAAILRLVERAAERSSQLRMPRLVFEPDGSLRIVDPD